MDIDKLAKSLFNGEDQPLNDNIKNLKVKSIQESLISSSSQFAKFVEYSRSTDGLINNEFRSKIWPILLGINDENGGEVSHELLSSNTTLNTISASFFLEDLNTNDLLPHKDEDQVKLDIQRSFTILNHIQSLQSQLQNESYTTIFSPSDMNDLKKKLSNLIIKILRKYPTLHYYQGFHDIASIVLLICHTHNEDDPQNDYYINEELAFKLLERLTVFHLRDFMINDMNLTINHLKLIPTLLEVVDPQLFELIKQTSNQYIQTGGISYDYSFYQSISCILTMFSHDISNIQHILIIWDFVFSYNSILINPYIYAAALIHFKDDIFLKLNVIIEDDDTDFSNVDSDIVHTLTSPNSLFDGLTDEDLIKILNKAKSLLEAYSIDEVKNSASNFDIWFKHFNPNSVLLTSSSIKFDNSYKREHFDQWLIGSNSFSELIQLQEDEIAKQTVHDLEVSRRIVEQQEELSNSLISETDFDSNSHSLSSSLSLTSTSSSTINTKITSSALFKKLFKLDHSTRPTRPTTPLSDKDENKKLINRNKDTHLIFNNIYKISFTIGFIGFLIHFLLIKNNPTIYNNGLYKMFSSSVSSPMKKIGESIIKNEPIHTITSEISNMSADIISDVGIAFYDVCTFVKNSEFVSHGISLSQVGLGGIRNTLFGAVS
ncbi:rab-GTPase-TBC domain-containing protein [Scheffersomyces amazonensis]|uniref:rab-GTPase-TBC domain-containing protein n=1 Tax=Scheffersomyces amazonensis TaxID=1078765 RepID=UPI00315DFDA4